jgi:hypothetical protein
VTGASAWWSCCHTPARYQSRRRRQQVTGLPQPSCWTGSSRQGTPVRLVDAAGQAGAVIDASAPAVAAWWGKRVGISLASASQHATVLRDAGLSPAAGPAARSCTR